MALYTNLVAAWNYDDGSGSTASDNTGNSHTGTWSASVAGQWGTGLQGGCAVFNGTDYFSHASSPALQLTGTLSISAWVKLSALPSSGNYATIVDFGYDGTNEPLYFRVTNSSGALTLDFGSYISGTTYGVSPTNPLVVGTWAHVVAVLDASNNYTLYVNNSIIAGPTSTAPTRPTTATPMGIGGAQISGTFGRFLAGSLDMVGIWSRALTSGDVSSLYNGGAGLPFSVTASFVVSPITAMVATPTTITATGTGTSWLSGTTFSCLYGTISGTSVNAGTQVATFTYTPPAFNPNHLTDTFSDSADALTATIALTTFTNPALPAQPIPGLLTTALATAATVLLPAAPFVALAGGGTNSVTFGSINSIAVYSGTIVVADSTLSKIWVLNTSGVLQHSWTVAYAFEGVGIDPSGNIYVVDTTNDAIRQYSPTGTLNWTFSCPHVCDWGGGYQSSGSWYMLCNQRTTVAVASQLVTTAGASGGTTSMGQDSVNSSQPHAASQVPGGNWVIADYRQYARSFDGSQAQTAYIGSAGGRGSQGTGGWCFNELAGTVRMTDGTWYVIDGGDGFYRFDPVTGVQTGFVPRLGYGVVTSPYDATASNVDQYAPMVSDGTSLYFASDGALGVSGATLLAITRTNLDTLFAYPQKPAYRWNNLGPGAGLLTGSPANFFASGATPTMNVFLDAWWTNVSGLSARYRITSYANIPTQGQTTAWTTLTLTLPTGGASASTAIPGLPSASGAYMVEAQLMRSGVAISAEACWYGVGVSGSTFNYAALSTNGGPSYGGATGQRSVQLIDELLGPLGEARLQFSWDSCLSTATGTPNFTPYDTIFTQASTEAASRGLTLSVQVHQGSVMDLALISSGATNYQAQTTALVNHYKTLLGANKIIYWECWNESNNTYSTNGGTFVTNVLQYFYAAVKAADATAKVVGPSALKFDTGFLTGFATAGGFGYVDILALHPYTDYGATYEEQGHPATLVTINALATAHSKPGIPIWFTEVGPNNQNYASVFGCVVQYCQVFLHGASSGVTKIYPYVPEGNVADSGSHYGLVEWTDLNNPVYAQPSAYAVMAAKSLFGSRAYSSSPTTNIPHCTAVQFGGSDKLLAIWTDEFTVGAVITFNASCSYTKYDVFGNATAGSGTSVTITATVLPTYIEFPTANTITIAGVETFSTNLALAGTASASSTNSNVMGGVSYLNDGIVDAQNEGISTYFSTPMWTRAATDLAPFAVVTLASTATVDRVLVVSHDIKSSIPGLRNYTVSTKVAGVWTVQSTVTDAFYNRSNLITFGAPVASCQAVRIDVQSVNYGSSVGGLEPWYWYPDASHPITNTNYNDPTNVFYGPTTILEIEVYAQGTIIVVASGTIVSLLAGTVHSAAALAGSVYTPPSLAGNY